MKKLVVLTVVVAVGLIMTRSVQADEHKTDAAEVTVTGEVLDMACYLDHTTLVKTRPMRSDVHRARLACGH